MFGDLGGFSDQHQTFDGNLVQLFSRMRILYSKPIAYVVEYVEQHFLRLPLHSRALDVKLFPGYNV